MKTCHIAAMEVFSQLPNGSFALEPYEAGWASEAMALVYVREVHGPAPALQLRFQISADGCRWIDTEPEWPPIAGAGGFKLALHGFGNWIRLAGAVTGGPDGGLPAFVADFYWSLKG